MDFNPVVLATSVWELNLTFHLYGAISFVLALLIFPFYINSMVKDPRHAPPKSTWLLWLTIDSVILGSRFHSGVFDAMMLAYVIGGGAVFITSLKYGKKGWTKTDTVCTVFVATAMIVWVFVNPLLVTIVALTGTAVGSMPLFLGVMKGEYENIFVWTVCIVSSFFNLLDGQVLVSLVMAGIQICVLVPLLYHHVYILRKKEGLL
ncbi:MAG: hypothetical protein K9M15_02055 [Candidatus Marinimicrobia bacterium]|nr:hypothetical protein [Candidatus Neomarinimicrobiota bacterium]